MACGKLLQHHKASLAFNREASRSTPRSCRTMKSSLVLFVHDNSLTHFQSPAQRNQDMAIVLYGNNETTPNDPSHNYRFQSQEPDVVSLSSLHPRHSVICRVRFFWFHLCQYHNRSTYLPAVTIRLDLGTRCVCTWTTNLVVAPTESSDSQFELSSAT